RRFLKYRYLGCSNKIYKEFRKYLKEVIHSLHQMKMIFTPNEIVRMLCGEDHIDLEDMRNHSQCGGDLKTNPIILAHFWSFLCTCNQTQLSSILHFALGTFKTPSGGFRNLSIVNNVPMPLTLISNKGSDNLLTSRTCFNRVNLPFETNYEKFKRICVMCLESCMGFGTD
ncbi:MAG: E3 ubiquitin-protein ligase nedd4, partial [Marteilia pararefringens]